MWLEADTARLYVFYHVVHTIQEPASAMMARWDAKGWDLTDLGKTSPHIQVSSSEFPREFESVNDSSTPFKDALEHVPWSPSAHFAVIFSTFVMTLHFKKCIFFINDCIFLGKSSQETSCKDSEQDCSQ